MIYLQDPVAGRIEMDEEEFKRRWHDREEDGTPYERYGIVVSDDLEPDEAELDADGEAAKAGGLVEAARWVTPSATTARRSGCI